MKPLEKILDIAFQKLQHNKRCFNCNKKSTAIHHIIRRANKLFRWDKRNALPVCFNCHFNIHNGVVKEPKLDLGHDDIKSYLLRKGMTYDEFLQAKMKEFGISQSRLPAINTKRTKKSTIRKNRKVQKPVAHKMTSTEKPVIRKNRITEKYNENWRKNQKELYRKKKEWLKNKKLGIS